MHNEAAAFDSACIMWTSQLMMESIVELASPWDRSADLMAAPTIYHALKNALSACPDYRRDDFKYFVPYEVYNAAMSAIPMEVFLINTFIEEDPVEVARSACKRGNSLAFLAARGVHNISFSIEDEGLGRKHLSVISTCGDWPRHHALQEEWDFYLYTLRCRSKPHDRMLNMRPDSFHFQESLQHDVLKVLCRDWRANNLLGKKHRLLCHVDMTKWELTTCSSQKPAVP